MQNLRLNGLECNAYIYQTWIEKSKLFGTVLMRSFYRISLFNHLTKFGHAYFNME